MNSLLQQFLSEADETLDAIGTDLMALEMEPDSSELVTVLFRRVHTLKGNSGLFDFPELTRVLHAGEDLMDAVREHQVAYSPALADVLLAAMDFVALLCADIGAGVEAAATRPAEADALVRALRALQGAQAAGAAPLPAVRAPVLLPSLPSVDPDWLVRLPAPVQAAMETALAGGNAVYWLRYTPDPGCFFEGCDPLHLANGTPELLWGGAVVRSPWPALAELDAYRCELDFDVLSSAPEALLRAHFRYVSEQVSLYRCPPSALTEAARVELIQAQLAVLRQADDVDWLPGRLQGVAASLAACLRASAQAEQQGALDDALAASLAHASSAPLLAWMGALWPALGALEPAPLSAPGFEPMPEAGVGTVAETVTETGAETVVEPLAEPALAAAPARRTDEGGAARTLRVDQEKVDRMMNLIGEMVVAKNAMPYLANRAEHFYGVRDMAREIKTQYAVIHRISEELQDAIMQMRMLPVSFVFQRFPRLVRDLAQRLGKQVRLVLEGENTAADKNLIEALGDPLVHIVRNCLDHGLETPEQRVALGKPAQGTLRICASQQADRVRIDISDDGRGIDPAIIRRKAQEKGLFDAATLARLSDQEAIQLVFTAGFSTSETVSDLSGRGVGMDVVRSSVEQLQGAMTLTSEVGKGTLISLSLPLSMAVSSVLTVESCGQLFGVPLALVRETVRIPAASVQHIKQSMTAVLRGRVVPLRSLNTMLALGGSPQQNSHGELALLVVELDCGPVGILIDEFHQHTDIVLKPLPGVLGRLPAYAGSAMMGDGSVLMVLNLREIV